MAVKMLSSLCAAKIAHIQILGRFDVEKLTGAIVRYHFLLHLNSQTGRGIFGQLDDMTKPVGIDVLYRIPYIYLPQNLYLKYSNDVINTPVISGV